MLDEQDPQYLFPKTVPVDVSKLLTKLDSDQTTQSQKGKKSQKNNKPIKLSDLTPEELANKIEAFINLCFEIVQSEIIPYRNNKNALSEAEQNALTSDIFVDIQNNLSKKINPVVITSDYDIIRIKDRVFYAHDSRRVIVYRCLSKKNED